MPKISVMMTGVLTTGFGDESGPLVETFASSPLVEAIFVPGDFAGNASSQKIVPIEDSPASGAGINRIIERLASDYLLWVQASDRVQAGQRMIERLIAVAEDEGSGLTYSDFREQTEGGVWEHPLI